MSEKTIDTTLPAGDQASVPAPSEPDPKPERVGSLWSDAWADLRRRPMFLISAFIILVLVMIAIFPGLFAFGDPTKAGACELGNSLKRPSSEHWFGYDLQGCDIYDRAIYGTRNSIIVGIVTTLLTATVGGLLGLIAGLRGGWLDTILSRITEVFFAVPLLLGGLLALSMLKTANVWTVSIVMAVFGWPQLYRIMRGAVLANKHSDYVMAAKALGADAWRVAIRHVLPNAVAPVVVVSTINLGVYISAEAALSYLGIGIQDPSISWGLMISDAEDRFLTAPHALLFPAAALSLTVLAFIMLGDAVRDALDPKLR